MSASQQRAHVRIEGRVQGVFFRAHAREAAISAGLSGWVRNVNDGSVEAVVDGTPQAVAEFVSWCHRGPPAARVDRVLQIPERADDPFVGFTIRRG